MRVRVDERVVDVPDGATVLDAVRAAGARVPTLCHDERIAPSGACRACLVRAGSEVVAACTAPASQTVRVRTDDPQVAATVRQVVALMVERLPVRARELPTELAVVCDHLGITADAFNREGRGLGVDESHPYVHLDRDLCIACGRCVRMCDELQGTFALTLTGRAADTIVEPGTGGPWIESACVACGGCVDSCPSGAITGPTIATSFALEAGLTRDRVIRTTCGYCGVGCALDVHARAGDVVAITPARDGPVNRGHACVKGRFAHGFVRSPERLTGPLIRRNGRLEEASWDEALALLARELGQIRDTHGPVDQRGELPASEVHAHRHRHQQRRQLLADLPRAFGSGLDAQLRAGRRYECRGGLRRRRLLPARRLQPDRGAPSHRLADQAAGTRRRPAHRGRSAAYRPGQACRRAPARPTRLQRGGLQRARAVAARGWL